MDLNKLRNTTLQADKGISSQILKKCDPKSYAQLITHELEKEATNAAKKGQSKARYVFTVWSVETRFRDRESIKKDVKTEGLLAYLGDSASDERNKVSEVFFGMVKEHITDENIKLELNYRDDVIEHNMHFLMGHFIIASVEW